MNWIKKHKKSSVLILVLILAAGLFLFTLARGGEGDPASGPAGTVFGRITAPFSSLGNRFSLSFAGKELQEENAKLRAENEALKQEVSQNAISSEDLAELRSLKKALNYVDSDAGQKYVSADIIAIDGRTWTNLFTINAGTEQNVKVGDVVVTGDGVAGVVRSVGNGWAKVAAVTDASVDLSFRVSGRPGIIGVLDDSDGSALSGFTLESSAAVSEGDTLITSGLGIYPEGIPIGQVTRVYDDNNAQLRRVTVRPAVKPASVRKVMVIV